MSSSTYNLILLKSSFKNRGILLNTLEREVFCYIVLKLRVFIHFGQNTYFTHSKATLFILSSHYNSLNITVLIFQPYSFLSLPNLFHLYLRNKPNKIIYICFIQPCYNSLFIYKFTVQSC